MNTPVGICTGISSGGLSVPTDPTKKRDVVSLILCSPPNPCDCQSSSGCRSLLAPCNFFPQNKAVAMTWRAWATCSCISTWARCPGRASRLPPSAKSTRGSARRRCPRPLRCSAKGTLVSALISVAVLCGAWLALLLKLPAASGAEGHGPVSPDPDVLLTPVRRSKRDP